MIISLKNLNKNYGRKVVISNFNFDFSDKGLYVIRGESGVGKTTLLRIIAGLDKDFSGEILGVGRENISFVFQEYRLFPTLSALQNITEILYEKPTDNEVVKAKEMLYSLGFSEAEIHLTPDKLSGGMKQRVSLARAFLKENAVLILDEPTKEMDGALCSKVRNMIAKEPKKRLVLMVTHNEDDFSSLDCTVINMTANTDKI